MDTADAEEFLKQKTKDVMKHLRQHSLSREEYVGLLAMEKVRARRDDVINFIEAKL